MTAMKKIIFILWVALASNGWLMANHWTPNSTPYEDNMTLTGIVRIDGVVQQTTALELGAFCGEECRGAARLAYFPPTQHFVVQMAVFGESGDEIAFKLYDHDWGEELELISLDMLIFMSDGYGSLANPYLFNFYSEYPGPHLITVLADPVGYGTVTGGGSYDHGTTVTLTATANEDYAFVNWTKDGEVVSTNATYSFEATEPGDYVAHFELSIIHHWTPSGSSFEDNMTLTGVVKINGVEQQTPMLEVAAFCGEECRGSGLLTYFAPTQRYVVQMSIYGESGDVLAFKLYDHELNEELDLYSTDALSFAANGYGSLANPYVLDFTEEVTETHTVAATVNPAESGTVEGTGTYLHGTTCILTATANEGYAFVNWTKDGTMVSVSTSYEFDVTSDQTFVANFVPLEDNHWTPNSAPYEDNMTLTGVVQINYVEQQTTALELGVFCGEECRGSARLAFFAPTQRYVVQMAIYGESGDELNFRLYDHVLNEELDLVPPDAITFIGDGYGSLQNPFVVNFRETFNITVEANPTEGGTVNGGGTYVYGTTTTLQATANEGYHFVNWTLEEEVVSTDATYSFVVTEAADYVANFELNSYDISVVANPEEGGTVTGAGTYNHFDTCTLTATANEGYHFVNWTLEGEVVSTDTTYSFVVTGAADYVANFELNSYNITVVANPEEGGIVTGAGTYNHFETCTLTATANEDYYFVNWTLEGEVVSTDATYSFMVTGSADYVANFELTAITQTSGFVQGWNWWSSYIELDAESSLQNLESNLGTSGMMIKSQNDGYASYLAGFGWYGSLYSINNESTYQIRTNEACTVELTGSATNPDEHPIELQSGWTWVGYPVNASMGVAEALSGITPQTGDMLKSQNDGYASYLDGFGWYGSLNTLQPGMGLMYKSNNNSAVTLVYPNGETRTDLQANQTTECNYWQPNLNAYPDNMSVMAVVELDGEELQGENYELAAFANGEVRGSARLLYVEPLNRYMAFLTVAGDEASDLRFGLYNTETGAIETQGIAPLRYETNAVVGSFAEPYVVSFRGNTGMDEWASSLNVYPNPVHRGQVVSLGFGDAETGEVQVEIVNVLGAVVETRRATSLQGIIAPETAGVYTLRVTVENKMTLYRKLVVR